MKRLFFFILLLCFLQINCLLFNHNSIFCNSFYYGKVLEDNVFFYSQPIDESGYQLFEIPKTFFVELTGNAGDTENLFYIAKYIDINGYIKKSDIQVVNGTPVQPFADTLSFRVFVPKGLELRSSPTTATPFNIIATVPYLETSLIYYGLKYGDEMISQKGNCWYYCKYISGVNKYYGYLYSSLCDLLPQIPISTENLEYYNEEIFKPVPIAETVDFAPNLSQEFKIVLIVLVSIPCLFVIYLLFKPSKLVIDNGKNGKKKIKKLRHSEYYEFDD